MTVYAQCGNPACIAPHHTLPTLYGATPRVSRKNDDDEVDDAVFLLLMEETRDPKEIMEIFDLPHHLVIAALERIHNDRL